MTEEHNKFMNRRTFARANIHVLARYVCPADVNPFEDETRISDFSEGGALIVTLGKELPGEALIKMEFIMPGNGILNLLGKIKYSDPLEATSYRSGVEFLELKEKDRLAIRQYVASHTQGKTKY